MRWGAYFWFLAFAVLIAEVYLLLVKPAGEIDGIFQVEYAALSMDQAFEETISEEVRQWAEEFKDFHLPNSKSGTAISCLIAFRWVVIQNLLPLYLIAASLGLSEGVLKRVHITETVGFFSPRQLHLGLWMLGSILSIFPGYIISPWVLPISYICIVSMPFIAGSFFQIASNLPSRT